MNSAIHVGDTFTVKHSPKHINIMRRESDDTAPMFACERMRVTHLTCSADAKLVPYTFGAEPEWFHRRGYEATPDATTPALAVLPVAP